MNRLLRHLLSKPTTTLTTLTRLISTHHHHPLTHPPTALTKHFHSTPPHLSLSSTHPHHPHHPPSSDESMNEFLSRFVHSMRGKLTDAYPDSDKPTIDSMLVLILDKLLSQMDGPTGESGDVEVNDELTQTMWEVSNAVYADMEKEKQKEKLKKYLQSDQVKSMARFASEVGVRGDMLRELRFKWAREVMEEAEFYDNLRHLKDDQANQEASEEEPNAGLLLEEQQQDGVDDNSENDHNGNGLPKRQGKLKYKLYGLDLSGEKWRDVADKVHEAEEVVWPSEAKEITGKCKVVTERIVGLGKDEDDSKVEELFKEWVELLQPGKVDWVALLQRLKQRDVGVYLKIAECVLDEPTFQADIQDYSNLIGLHAKENRMEDAERILKKMNEKGIAPDAITLTALLHMYSKANNLEQAKEVYEALRSQGFKPDKDIYNSMIMAYINAGQPKAAESLARETELTDIKPSEEIYMELLRAFAQRGDMSGAQRILTTMQFAGFQPTAESCTLLIEACGKSGSPHEARNNFDYMMQLGHKPDDRCTAIMVSAYEKKNELDKALSLLLQLEKDGFEPGILTYSVLVDWLGKLQLIDEAEQILGKIAQLGEAPPFKIQVSLCDMYARAGVEKKALQALGVLEAKKELLEGEDFERIIQALLKGGFMNDVQRITKLMEGQGFTPSQSLNISLMASQAFGRK